MAPGPKPKGTPKRQTLGVAVRPAMVEKLDVLVEDFQKIQNLLIDWLRLPTTRSSVAEWLLERSIDMEHMKLRTLLHEYSLICEYGLAIDDGTLPPAIKLNWDTVRAQAEEIAANDSNYSAIRAALRHEGNRDRTG